MRSNLDFYSLFELAQIEAISVAIEPTMDSMWRSRCRDYSIRFHTPLHVVMNELNPMTVLQALYEDRYHPSIVQDELEELLDILNKIKDPSYARMSAEETEALVDAVLNREIARFEKKKKKAPTTDSIQADIKQAQPKSGSMNFGELESLEAEKESGKGFRD